MILGAAPIDPSPDQARDWLQRELAHPEYHQENLLARALRWIAEQWHQLTAAASSLSWATTVAALVIGGLLIALLLWLLTRARWSAAERGAGAALLPAVRLSAAEHRRLADAALAEGDYATAVVEGFRSVALGQIERGRIEDHPEATARETAATLTAACPWAAERLAEAVGVFDDVLYGERAATHAQAVAVLSLDLDLVPAR